MLATLAEISDAWGRQIVSAVVAVHGGKVRMGDPIHIRHPDRPEAEEPKPEITTSPAEIAEFFKRRIG